MSAALTRPLRIFIAHPSDLLTDHRPHGDGLVSFGFISRLARRGHEVHVAAQVVDVRGHLPPTLHVYELLPGSRLAIRDRLAFMLRMRVLFDRLCTHVRFDLIHQMNPVFTGLSLSLMGVRTPLVLGAFVPAWQGGADDQDARRRPGARVQRLVLEALARVQQSRASGLLITSPAAMSRIARPERHLGRIYEIPHGIDLTRFPERSALPERPSVLFLANVIYRKGIFTLLEAFEQVARDVPGARLVIAGQGEQLEEVREKVAHMNTAGIEVLGNVDRTRVPEMMRSHSLYCLPSHGEPFGMSVLEAMASGVPVVATDGGGLSHLVTPQGSRLVPPRDAGALANAIVEVLRSPDLQRAMGRHNRRRVEAEFEIEGAVDRLEQAYASVLA